jgi:hypothetical protein
MPITAGKIQPVETVLIEALIDQRSKRLLTAFENRAIIAVLWMRRTGPKSE